MLLLLFSQGPAVTGTIAATLQPCTAASSGTVSTVGQIAVTLESCTAAAVGSVSSSGTIAATLGAAICVASGTVTNPPPVGTINVTLSPCASGIEGWVGQRPVFRVAKLTYERVTAFSRTNESAFTRPMPQGSIALYSQQNNVLIRPKPKSDFISEVLQ
jgi:hypothetical protein